MNAIINPRPRRIGRRCTLHSTHRLWSGFGQSYGLGW